MKIVTGKEKFPLYDLIKDHSNIVDSIMFSNENIRIKILGNVRNENVYVIQPNYPNQNERIVELLITIDALRLASAGKIIVVLPYFPYCRSDKKGESHTSITASLLANLLQAAGTNHVITMHLHSPQTQGFFKIPVDHLSPKKIVCDYLKEVSAIKGLKEVTLVAPDTGSSKMIDEYANELNVPAAYMSKMRIDDSEKPIITSIAGNVNKKDCIILDDEIASGRSIINAAILLKNLGASSIRACAVHGIFTGNSEKDLRESPIEDVYVTNTIWRSHINYDNDFIHTIDVSCLFKDTINSIS